MKTTQPENNIFPRRASWSLHSLVVLAILSLTSLLTPAVVSANWTWTGNDAYTDTTFMYFLAADSEPRWLGFGGSPVYATGQAALDAAYAFDSGAGWDAVFAGFQSTYGVGAYNNPAGGGGGTDPADETDSLLTKLLHNLIPCAALVGIATAIFVIGAVSSKLRTKYAPKA